MSRAKIRQEKGKQSFFEKKDQKTFLSMQPQFGALVPRNVDDAGRLNRKRFFINQPLVLPCCLTRSAWINTALHLAGALMMASPTWASAQPNVAPTETAKPPDADHNERAAKSPRHKGAPVYHLLGFRLSGTNRVDTDALIAALPQHKGDVITHEQIKDDADRIRAVLKTRHVHGEMTTATLERDSPGHYLLVVWDIHLLDVLSYTPSNADRHFAGQTFSGNVTLDADQLAKAAGLKSGQDMPDGSISDARTGLEQAYDKALPGKTVDVTGKVTLKKDKTVLIDWHITEHK